MPRYYCDYCDTYLTHDSPSVRKQHNAGYKHKANVRSYYQQYEAQLNQTLIDQKVKEHLGQASAYQLRPRPPVLPTPMFPMAGSAHLPGSSSLIIGFRPPILPRPVPGALGYAYAPVGQPTVAPPGAPSLPVQVSGLPKPMTVPATALVLENAGTSNSGGVRPVLTPTMYQPDTATQTTGSASNNNKGSQTSWC